MFKFPLFKNQKLQDNSLGIDSLVYRLTSFEKYKIADPYPHIVLDDALNSQGLRVILKEWPQFNDKSLEEHNDGKYVVGKKGTTHNTTLGPNTKTLINELNSPKFLIALENMTGIAGLIPDPYQFGGGLHTTRQGGKLAVHVDFNKHFKYSLERRLNLLLYLNEGWKEENSGSLELWDSKGQKCEKSILPIFNRMVIFTTNSGSYHGQPRPIVGKGVIRRSLALYYYSVGRPEEPLEIHDPKSTVWLPQDDD
jgi:Rps23 Pro-64 3,4-dihydroxylase Tpa1-like proline 4-hydroxylase